MVGMVEVGAGEEEVKDKRRGEEGREDVDEK